MVLFLIAEHDSALWRYQITLLGDVCEQLAHSHYMIETVNVWRTS